MEEKEVDFIDGHNGDPKTRKLQHLVAENVDLSRILEEMQAAYRKYGVTGEDIKSEYAAFSLETDFGRYKEFLDNVIDSLLKKLKNKQNPKRLADVIGLKGSLNPAYVLFKHLSEEGSKHPYYDTFLIRQRKLNEMNLKLALVQSSSEQNFFILDVLAPKLKLQWPDEINLEEIQEILVDIGEEEKPTFFKEVEKELKNIEESHIMQSVSAPKSEQATPRFNGESPPVNIVEHD
jgi:hypothetical protein